jgi:hypothetical protein
MTVCLFYAWCGCEQFIFIWQTWATDRTSKHGLAQEDVDKKGTDKGSPFTGNKS